MLQLKIYNLYVKLGDEIISDKAYIQYKHAYNGEAVDLKKFRKAKRIIDKLIKLGEPMSKILDEVKDCIPNARALGLYNY